MSYEQLTREERFVIYHLRGEQLSVREIARRLNRHHSTISRELKRNGTGCLGEVYWPMAAQECAQQRRQQARHHRRRANGALCGSVVDAWRDVEESTSRCCQVLSRALCAQTNLPEIALPSKCTRAFFHRATGAVQRVRVRNGVIICTKSNLGSASAVAGGDHHFRLFSSRAAAYENDLLTFGATRHPLCPTLFQLVRFELNCAITTDNDDQTNQCRPARRGVPR